MDDNRKIVSGKMKIKGKKRKGKTKRSHKQRDEGRSLNETSRGISRENKEC